MWQTARTVEAVPYSAFEQALADGRVAHEPQRPAFLDVPGLVQNGWQPGPETRQRIDETVRSTVKQAIEEATHLLQDRREVLERCALSHPPVARLPTPDVQAS